MKTFLVGTGAFLLAMSALGATLATGCGRQQTFSATAPEKGPGELVGRKEALNADFQGGVSADIPARDVATPDWQECDGDCIAHCDRDFKNPIDQAICPALWGAGLDTRPIDEHEACRRLYADLRGEFPTLAEVEADCVGKDLSKVAQDLIEKDAFVMLNQQRWADTLRYNNVALNVERIYDADVLVKKLYQGKIRFDEFVEVISAHPVLTRRFNDPGDRVAGLFDIFVGRPPYDNERADMAKLYVLWSNGYYDHPELGLRLPDSMVRHTCLTEEGEIDPQTAGACTSVLWGFNRLILKPDFRSIDNETWAGNLTEEEWKLLQTPGRIIGAWPEVWEKAASEVVSLYLGYDLVQYVPTVVQKLVEHVLAHGGDIRAAHHAVVTSQLYLQSTTCSDEECDPAAEDVPPWTFGPLRQADPELWVNSLRALTGQELDRCDHRIPMPDEFLQGSLAGLQLVDKSYWKLDERDQLQMGYANLLKTLGGCPDNEVSGRFKTVSILNTATQEGYASEVCNPSGIVDGGADVSLLLPDGARASTELTDEVAVQTLEHQVATFFGRPATDEERAMATAGANSCVPKPCNAESFGRSLCYALLSSSEMLFY